MNGDGSGDGAAEKKASLRRSIREGLDPLTVTGPSPTLEKAYQEAQEAVENLPTQEARQAAFDQAWAAFDKPDQLMIQGDVPAAMQAMDEAFSLLRAGRPDSRRS